MGARSRSASHLCFVLSIAFALAAAFASAAGAATIAVDEVAETVSFDKQNAEGQPTSYSSLPTGVSNGNGRCSLREAVAAANANQAVDGCSGGSGPGDTIALPAGDYGVYDNFNIAEAVEIVGANAGLAGNDPGRGAETTLTFLFNPNSVAQSSMFFLTLPSPDGPADGAGSGFDGLELVGTPNTLCTTQTPGQNCQELAIIDPDLPKAGVAPGAGYALRNSIVRGFSAGVWIGGDGTSIRRNLFKENDSMVDVPSVRASGIDIYADSTYTSLNARITHNVFAAPVNYAISANGNVDRGTLAGALIRRNLFRKTSNHDQVLLMNDVRGVRVEDNLFANLVPTGAAAGTDAILIDRADQVAITGNTILGFRAAVSFSDIGAPGPASLTDVRIANNRIYRNQFGLRVRAPYAATAPTGIDARDNWWGANGGAGANGNREGDEGPVNGVQFRNSSGAAIPEPANSGVDSGDPLQLTCSMPSKVTANTPVPLTGAVAGMPAIDRAADQLPWFAAVRQPRMEASVAPAGKVFGFGGPPSNGALAGAVIAGGGALTGALVPTSVGTGAGLVALDSQQVRCPFQAAPADIVIDKTTSERVVDPGQPVTYRLRVRNRGRAPVYGLRACDKAPRELRFLRSSHRLVAGRERRCLVLSRSLRPRQTRSVRLTFRVSANASGTIENVGHVETMPPEPDRNGMGTGRRRHDRDEATVIVRRGPFVPCRIVAQDGPTATASC